MDTWAGEIWLHRDCHPFRTCDVARLKFLPQTQNANTYSNVIDSITHRWLVEQRTRENINYSGPTCVAALEFACYQRQNISIKMSPIACSPPIACSTGFDSSKGIFYRIGLRCKGFVSQNSLIRGSMKKRSRGNKRDVLFWARDLKQCHYLFSKYPYLCMCSDLIP